MAAYDAEQIRARYRISDIAARFGAQLKPDGAEWRGCCCFHQERTPSFTVYGNPQKFYCFGCQAHGDVIDFVRELCGVDFREACEILDGKPGETIRTPTIIQPPADPYAGWVISTPPDDAPLLVAGVRTPALANPKRDRSINYTPSLVHPYLNAAGDLQGYVLRVDIDDRKMTPQIVWATAPTGHTGWSHGAFPEPRPMYGLADVLAYPGRQVLVVEGEKCADAGRVALIGKMVVVSWAGGGKAWHKTDWEPLRGRRVVLWPDADEQGRETMQAMGGHLAGLGATCRLIDPEADRPKGWDVADAVAEGWGFIEIQAFAKARAREWEPQQERSPIALKNEGLPQKPVVGKIPQTQAIEKPYENSELGEKPTIHPSRDNIRSLHGDPIPVGDPLDDYRSNFITDGDGKVKPRLTNNFEWMLRGHPDTRGLFAWNEVAQGVFVMDKPPWDGPRDGKFQQRPQSESDIMNTLTWLERRALTPRKSEVRDTIKNVASKTRYNPVLDYLGSLKWDGCPRLQGGMWEGSRIPPLATEYLDAPDDPIFGTFVWKWHVAAIARAFRPGTKADAMVVFESTQGKQKSTYLRAMATINGVEYFADSVNDIQSDKSIMQLQGVWLVEIAELAGLDRKEVGHVKAWLSRTTDRFVPKYESEPREVPRHYVVAGTHNPSGHGYLKDPTGARRFWPVPVGNIRLSEIERDRDQIWAEAVALYRAGAKHWLTADEEKRCAELTDERRVEDPWGSKIADITRGRMDISLGEVIKELQIPVAQQTEVTTKRILEHLTTAGFVAEGRGVERVWRKHGPH